VTLRVVIRRIRSNEIQLSAAGATALHQQKQIEALTAGLQKVSAQLEVSKPAPQVVNNNQ
jgi:hypothetical protein